MSEFGVTLTHSLRHLERVLVLPEVQTGALFIAQTILLWLVFVG